MISRSDFWDDQENAQEILKEQSNIKEMLDEWNDLNNRFEELEVLEQLSEEASDRELKEEAEEKLKSLVKSVEDLEFRKILGEQDDIRNAIVSINAGAGGTEAQDWAEMLFRMYLRYCERHGYQTRVMDLQEGDEAGIKSATFLAEGQYAYGYLKGESGVHRLVRVSPYDSNNRRHTSFASVFVSPEIDDSIEVDIDEKDLRTDTFRASGKGGQHVNKTDSAVRLTHIPTGIVVSCQNERSQRQNKDRAMKMLRARLYEMEKVKQREKQDELNSTKKEIGWGSQIRSYVMHPYRMVKDHRTDYEESDVDSVMDGELDDLIKEYLVASA